MNNVKNKILALIQTDNSNALPILEYLLEERSQILKDYVYLVKVIGPQSSEWAPLFTSIRKKLMNLGIEFEISDYTMVFPIDNEFSSLIVPLSQTSAEGLASSWVRELKIDLYQSESYWKPVIAGTRFITSYLPGINSDIIHLFDKCEAQEMLSEIPNLIITSRSIDCNKIRKLNRGLIQDKAKSLLKRLKDSLGSSSIAVRSHNPEFGIRIYVTKQDYMNLSDNSKYHLMDNFVNDIRLYSESHPNNKLFIQPYYNGVEFTVNAYLDDSGNPRFSIFKLVKDEFGGEHLTPRSSTDEWILDGILRKISQKFKLKSFSAKFIKLDEDKYALINLQHSFDNYLAYTLRYQLDVISYELTRGLLNEDKRRELLIGKYLNEYTDKTFKVI